MGIGTSGSKVNLVTSRIASNLRLSSVHVPLQSLFLGGNVRVAFSHSNKLGTSLSGFFSDYNAQSHKNSCTTCYERPNWCTDYIAY